jgi:AraC-like DNA-binding protein
LTGVIDQLSTIVIFGGIIQGPFVALLLNSRRVRKSRGNIFLSILLIAFSFSIFHIIYAGRVMNHFAVAAFHAGDPTFFLIAPLLWFYVRELTGSRVRFTWQLIIHFTPFLLLIGISLLFKSERDAFSAALYQHPRIAAVVFWLVLLLQFTFYQFLIRKRWNGYQKMMEQEVSNTEDVNIGWVQFFIAIFLIINIIFLLGLFAAIHLNNFALLNRNVAVIFSISVFALGYKGILQREIFFTEDITDKISKSPIEAKADQKDIDRLLIYMANNKPYLDPELTLSSLAAQMKLSRSQLSQLINDGVGENFYNFVNKYRVEQVKKFMVEPALRHFSMLGLALEAGFKSKSTFNLIFKRFTGLTPTEYRKNLTQQDVRQDL